MFNIPMMFKVSALFAATIASAHATTFSEGNLAGRTISIGQSFARGAAISDDYMFDIMPTSSYASIVASISLGSLFSIDGLAISLSGNGIIPVIRNLGAELSALSIGPLTLAAGTGYDFHVSGTATGTYGGAYAGVLEAAPVSTPVPTAVWLLGSGLIGVAGIARRK